MRITDKQFALKIKTFTKQRLAKRVMSASSYLFPMQVSLVSHGADHITVTYDSHFSAAHIMYICFQGHNNAFLYPEKRIYLQDNYEHDVYKGILKNMHYIH